MPNEITIKVNIEFDEDMEEKIRQIVRDEIKKSNRLTNITADGIYTGTIEYSQIILK